MKNRPVHFHWAIRPTKKSWSLGLSVCYAYINTRGKGYTGTHIISLRIVILNLHWTWAEKAPKFNTLEVVK